MAKINIRESLGRLDLLTDNKYDLRNTYDSSNISNDKKKKLAESLNNNASAKQLYSILNEDTIKQNGKWVNKGSEGTHGKFKTKKAADAQRKAMFANGYKGESLEEDVEDDFDSDEYEREHILRLAKAVKEASKGADERKLSNLKKTAKKYLTNHKGTKHEKEYAVLQKAYDSLLDEDWEPDKWEETDFLDDEGKKVYIKMIKEAEDIDDLKDIAHDLYWHDKGLFAMLRNFPKDKSFEWIQNRMIEVIKSTMNESLNEDTYTTNEINKFIRRAMSMANNMKKDFYVVETYIEDGTQFNGYAVTAKVDPQDKAIVKASYKDGKVSVKKLKNESLTEASYGGAYDIEDDMFWTKDDLIEFSDAVCEKLADKFGYQYDIADVGAESNNDMYITIMDTTHDIEADVSFRIKMSRIRAPRDLMKYLDTVVSQFVKKFEEEYQYYEFDESLNEAIDVSKAMVAKEFNYEINYGGKSSKVSHAVIVIPDAVRFDNELSDLVIYAEDENGKVINFSSVDEANDWINKYKDTANFHWERDELHATPAEFVDESLNEELVDAPQEIIDKLLSVLEEYGFVLDDSLAHPIGKTWFGNTHIQVINKNSHIEDVEDKDELYRQLEQYIPASMTNEIDLFRVKYDVPVTWNFGVNENREVTGGLDVHKQYIPDKDESLKEAVEDEINVDEYEETDFNDGEVEEGDTFIEDGREWSWIERIAGPIHLDFDNWAVWSARDWDYIEEKVKPLLVNKEEFNVEVLAKIYDEAEVAYFVVDEDTGFIDWGPVETQTEAQDFLNGKVEDWENDEYDESLKESKQLKESSDITDNGYSYTLHYEDIGDGKEYDYEVSSDEMFDFLNVLSWENGDGPEDIDMEDHEQWDNWVADNIDELIKKYEDNILDHFREDASQEEYDNRDSDDREYDY